MLFIDFHLSPFVYLLFNLTYYWGGQFKSINILHISGELVRAANSGGVQICAENGVFLGGGQK